MRVSRVGIDTAHNLIPPQRMCKRCEPSTFGSTVAIGLCTHGMLEGEFPATYDATFLTMVPAGDASDPSKYVYTGVSVVTPLDGSGVIYTEDTGVIHMPAPGSNSPAPFVTKAIVSNGSSAYKKTTGGFIASGELLFSTGAAEGSFSAVLCGK